MKAHTALTIAALTMISMQTWGQTVLDAQTVGAGLMGASVRDGRDFLLNPAGLVRIRDWDISSSTYMSTGTKQKGFVFHSIAAGKRFFDNEAVAFQYTPGSSLRFTVPPSLDLSGSNTPQSNDKEITYTDEFALGYAHRFSSAWSIGVSGRTRTESVTENRYQIVVRDTLVFAAASRTKSEANSWLFDAGVLWTPDARWSVSLVGRRLAAVRRGDDNESIAPYKLPSQAQVEASVVWSPTPDVSLGFQGSSARTGALGCEWSPLHSVKIRGGLYGSRFESPVVYAFAIGAGATFQMFEVNVSWLRFLNQNRHTESRTAESFDVAGITSLDLNPFSLDRLTLSAHAMFGRAREALVRIEGVNVSSAIYPSGSEVFAYSPLGTVRVRNISGGPVQAKAGFFVETVMDGPTESPGVYIAAGSEADIPLTAVFNERIRSVPRLGVRDGNVYVTATPAGEYDDRTQTRVLIHGRNDWDGNAPSLRFFVTPDDPAVLRYSRDILVGLADSLTGGPTGLDAFRKAKALIAAFAGKLSYVSDPKQSADFVQYPSETLQLRGGDCDDMTVLFSSLLGSIGISTAFVDVVPPGSPADAHIYLLFDTGVDPRYGSAISANPKRYVVRKNKSGRETIWLPIETTLIAKGFETAWTGGAQRYFDDVEVGLGAIKGWVRIVDVN